MALMPLAKIQLSMWQPLSVRTERRLEKRWDLANLNLSTFVPEGLKGKLSNAEILSELKRLGRFEEKQFREASQAFHPNDSPQKALVLGVNQRAVGSQLLADATKAGLETVWVDLSSVACADVKRSLSSQKYELERKNISPVYQVLQTEIHNFLLTPHRQGIDLDEVKLWFVPMTLGYLLSDTASLVLERAGQSLSEFKDPGRENRALVIGQLADYNPYIKRKAEIMRYYRRRDIMARLRHGAGGRKIEILSEKKFIYFEEVVSALTIAAK